jgi:hypothetical protein
MDSLTSTDRSEDAVSRRPAVAVPRDAMTVVCCVESGGLEHQTVRLVESLRRWGGAYADAPVVAVTPRLGPPLLRSTRRAFDELGVDHVRSRTRAPYLWQHYVNKPLAIATAAERASTPLLAWFDSDIIVVGEPTELAMADDEDFLACARDRGIIGSTGPDDPKDAFWAHACAVAGLDLDNLPWVRTEQEGERIRLYWNSGLFVFRRDSGLADDYLRLNIDLLDSRVGTVSNRLQYNDQVALGLSMLRCGLRWRALGHSHNYGVSKWHPYLAQGVERARIIHYHDSLSPEFYPDFVDQVGRHHADTAAWLSERGPLPRPGAPYVAVSEGLRAVRSVRRRRFYRQCRWI